MALTCVLLRQDREKQENLRKAAEELRYITVDYAQGQDIVGSQVARLQVHLSYLILKRLLMSLAGIPTSDTKVGRTTIDLPQRTTK